jgi:hypothetical protein
MYECEAENQFKVSKAFINIDGKNFNESKKKFSLKFFFLETILFNTTTTISPKYHRTLSSSSSPSYGRFHYIWQMERRLAL